MNKLLYALFISIFFLDYLSAEMGLLSRYITWLPDILSLIGFLSVIMLASMGGNNAIPGKYLIFITIFIVHIFLGIVLNGVSTGPMIAGLRNSLKFLPFFLLPMVYNFSEIQIRRQLQFLLVLVLFQTPVSLYQRLVQYKGALSGDMMSGTVGGNSGLLAIICICTMAIVMGFYLKNRIRLPVFGVLIILLFIPVTIGETKASLVFLPLAFIVPILLMSGRQLPLGKSILLIVLGVLAIIAFFVIYDYFLAARWGGRGLMDFLTSEGRLEEYLYRGKDADTLSYDVRLGRIDSWVLALQELSKNVFSLMFGMGVGNVSGSFLGSEYSGEFTELAFKYGVKSNSVALFLWEIGIVGVLLYFLLFKLVFSDARRLSSNNELSGAIALGWSAAVLIIFIAVFYKTIFGPNVTGYLFWYFSGYIAAARYRHLKKMRV